MLGSEAYRKLCEDPAWNGLRGVSVEGYTFCRGYRPSQYIDKRTICETNQLYDCIDRSDETGCLETSEENMGDITRFFFTWH